MVFMKLWRKISRGAERRKPSPQLSSSSSAFSSLSDLSDSISFSSSVESQQQQQQENVVVVSLSHFKRETSASKSNESREQRLKWASEKEEQELVETTSCLLVPRLNKPTMAKCSIYEESLNRASIDYARMIFYAKRSTFNFDKTTLVNNLNSSCFLRKISLYDC